MGNVESGEVEAREGGASLDADVLVERKVGEAFQQVVHHGEHQPEAEKDADDVEDHPVACVFGKDPHGGRQNVEPRDGVEKPQVGGRLGKKQKRRGEDVLECSAGDEGIDRSVDDDPEHQQKQDAGEVLAEDFLRRVGVSGRKHERPADHDENAHAKAGDAVVKVQGDPLVGTHGNVVPGGSDGMLEHHGKRRDDSKDFGVEFPRLYGSRFHAI